WLRQSGTHPTAAEIHHALLPKSASLSLGTVYRNLDVLVATGEIDEVAMVGGATRYDGNVSPHHHFNCDRCGQIFDVDLRDPRGLRQRLERDHGFSSTHLRISFFGSCSDCTKLKTTSKKTNTQPSPSKHH
ncbi:MAG: transcriptional repressor, partial [Myxococcota bacterium]